MPALQLALLRRRVPIPDGRTAGAALHSTPTKTRKASAQLNDARHNTGTVRPSVRATIIPEATLRTHHER